MSTYSIAEIYNTYPNRIRRAILYHGLNTKNHARSQKDALESGRTIHPTKGKPRSQETKNKIGDKLRITWENITPEKAKAIREKCIERWNNMTEAQHKEFSTLAAKAVRKTADEGSFFEHQVYTMLTNAGFNVVFHKERIIDYTEMHIDLFLPDYGIAIEIDGPSHFYPIYGEDVLLKRIEADTKKTGILLANGYIVVRICDVSRYHSASALREFNTKIIKLINEIKDDPPQEIKDRHFEINFGKSRQEEWGKRKGK